MRAQEIIKSVLDLIDQIENTQEPQAVAIVGPEPQLDLDTTDDQLRRFQQIAGLMAKDLKNTSMYANEPDEMYADIDAVTSMAGGGINSPKHPSDIRGEHPSMYPFLQYKG